MMPWVGKLRNRPLCFEEARKAAKDALQEWYTHGYNRANAIIPQMQIDSNLKVVAAIPGWQEQKGPRNGYVMLTTLIHGLLRPTILVLATMIFSAMVPIHDEKLSRPFLRIALCR